MRRCDTEVRPNLTQFHVRPLAVGAPAPASVVNHDLSLLLRLWIPSRSETSLFAPLRALVKNDEGHTWTLFWRHGMPFEGSMVSLWSGRYPGQSQVDLSYAINALPGQDDCGA